MPRKQSDIFWDQDDRVELRFNNPDEAVEGIIDEMYPTPIEEIGDITIYEYKRANIEMSGAIDNDKELMIENIYERLDEEYGDHQNGEFPDIPHDDPEIQQAWDKFVESVEKTYVPWACEKTGNTITVNALEWVKENMPEWLEGEKNFEK
ncbi:MAG: hypothetical protein JRI34_00820 [Deltaproteobacteria bacterium]|nr:hypothetical protein [Deltaproteobacteria bacterium]